jgi:hypothetical protein
MLTVRELPDHVLVAIKRAAVLVVSLGLVIVGVGFASKTRVRPIPLGRSAAVGGGWYLRIMAVDWNAQAEIDAVPNQIQYRSPVPPQAREVMLAVAYSYRGGGQSNATVDFADRVFAIGKHKAPYSWASGLNACGPGSVILPAPDAQVDVEREANLFSGTTISGHICFEVAANDVSTLRLYVKPPEKYPPSKRPPVFYAVRR